jgi:hypothetical protein
MIIELFVTVVPDSVFFSGTDAIVFKSINHLSIEKLFVLQVCAQKT